MPEGAKSGSDDMEFPDRCAACGVSKQQVLQHAEKWRQKALAEGDLLRAMTAARDLCKQQTADVDRLRQWQVQHAGVALQAIIAHGSNGVWTAGDCATQAAAALERMRSPVGSVSPGMEDPGLCRCGHDEVDHLPSDEGCFRCSCAQFSATSEGDGVNA